MASFGSSVESLELALSRRNTLGASLWRSAQLWPQAPALSDAGRGLTFSYAELNERVNRTASLLARNGVRRGSRVALVLQNRPELIDAYYAAAKLGAVCVPMNFRLLPQEIRALAEHAACTHVIAEPVFADPLIVPSSAQVCWVVGQDRPGWKGLDAALGDPAEWPSEVVESDTFGFMYSAGTTGLPKASIKTHGEYTFAGLSFLLRLNSFLSVDPGCVMLFNTPLFHGGGFVLLAMAVAAGWHSVMLSAFTPDGFREAASRFEPRITWLVPTMLAMCLDAGVSADDLRSIEVIISAGAPLHPNLRARAEQAWPRIVILDVLGQTEACGPLTSPVSVEHIRRKPGTLGRPIFGLELSIRTQDGTKCGPGVAGEVCYRGPILSQGYHRNPDLTVSAFRDGWFHSGDIGYVDEEGDLYVFDRVDDMIISGGENVLPSEVEDVLMSHPAVADACAFGLPDQVWGQRITAAVVLARGVQATAHELIEHCRSRLASYKCPRTVLFWDQLPKSAVGKILRRQAREHALVLLSERESADERN